MARSLNKVELIGNLTRDPELRYTPQGTAVCTFGLATNRSWTTDSGEKREEADFHRLVAWNKLAELCSQLLTKGRKIYIEGRLSTRNWTAQDGTSPQTTEIIVNDMIILDSKQAGASETEHSASEIPDYVEEEPAVSDDGAQAQAAAPKKTAAKPKKDEPSDEVNPDDIPF
jgi:single-strand DNA-binding protein